VRGINAQREKIRSLQSAPLKKSLLANHCGAHSKNRETKSAQEKIKNYMHKGNCYKFQKLLRMLLPTILAIVKKTGQIFTNFYTFGKMLLISTHGFDGRVM
jgi:hypothetical protein